MRILLRTAYSLTAYSSIVCSAKPGELPCQRRRAEPCDWLTNKLVSIRMDRPWIRKRSSTQAWSSTSKGGTTDRGRTDKGQIRRKGAGWISCALDWKSQPRIYPERRPLELHLQPKLNRPRTTAADDGVRGGNI